MPKEINKDIATTLLQAGIDKIIAEAFAKIRDGIIPLVKARLLSPEEVYQQVIDPMIDIAVERSKKGTEVFIKEMEKSGIRS